MKREVRLNLHTVRYRGEVREVYTLREPPPHVYVFEQDVDQGEIYADAGGFGGLANLAALAARHPRRIFYYRRSGARPDSGQAEHRSDDLVFVHRQAQLRPAHWRDLRNHLGTGRPGRLTYEKIPADFSYDLPQEDHGGRGMGYARHASTQFITGTGDDLLALAELWGRWFARSCHTDSGNAWDYARRRWGGGELFDYHWYGWHQWLEGPDYEPTIRLSLDNLPFPSVGEAKRALNKWGYALFREGRRYLYFRPIPECKSRDVS